MDRETRNRLRKAAEERAKRKSGEGPAFEDGQVVQHVDEPLSNTLQPAADEGLSDLARFAAAAPPADEIDCPFCAERIKAKARVCKHCDRDLTKPAPKASRRPSERTRRVTSDRSSTVVHHHHKATVTKSPGTAAVLAFLIPGLGHIYAGRIAFGLVFMIVVPVVFLVGSFVVLGAGMKAGSAAGLGGGILVVWLAAFAVHVFQVYDAYSSASSSGSPSPRRRPRR